MSVLKIGVYGKLPAHPDFVSEAVSSDISNELYDWAQQVIYRTSGQMSETDWLSAYLVSPIWRMCVPPNAERKHSWIGMMMPSVDAVGRYFPLFMLFEIDPKHICVEWLFKEADPLFAIMEEVGLKALQKRLALSDVMQALSAQTQQLELGEQACIPTPVLDTRLRFSSAQPETEQFTRLLQTTIAQLEGSVWWSAGEMADWQQPLIHCLGLPSPEDYRFLLTGQTHGPELASESLEKQG